MGGPRQILVLPFRGSLDPRFALLRREIATTGHRLLRVTRPLVPLAPTVRAQSMLRLLP